MDRAKARELHAKLLALADPSRGGTPAECALAQEKADALAARFDLSAQGYSRKPLDADVMSATPEASFPFSTWEAWAFDWVTGEHSPNVKVHRHDSPGSWHIEIFRRAYPWQKPIHGAEAQLDLPNESPRRRLGGPGYKS